MQDEKASRFDRLALRVRAHEAPTHDAALRTRRLRPQERNSLVEISGQAGGVRLSGVYLKGELPIPHDRTTNMQDPT